MRRRRTSSFTQRSKAALPASTRSPRSTSKMSPNLVPGKNLRQEQAYLSRKSYWKRYLREETQTRYKHKFHKQSGKFTPKTTRESLRWNVLTLRGPPDKKNKTRRRKQTKTQNRTGSNDATRLPVPPGYGATGDGTNKPIEPHFFCSAVHVPEVLIQIRSSRQEAQTTTENNTHTI